MNNEYWAVPLLVVAGVWVVRRCDAFVKRLESIPAAKGILEYRGDCVYVSPLSIINFDKEAVDVEKMNPEPLDSVVRLRMVQIFDAINDPVKRLTDPNEIIKLKRMATVHSAVTGTNIHKSMFHIDRETKRLYVGIQHRQELVSISADEVPQLIYTKGTQDLLRNLGNLDFALRQEFFNAMGRNEYDYFHIFVTKVRRRIRKHRYESYTDDQIQSCITGFAARLGFQIPRSYVRIDSVTSAVVHWDKEAEINDTTNVVRMQR